MASALFTDEEYHQQNFIAEPLAAGEYDGCVFRNCAFAGAMLDKITFIDCRFEECDLSNASIAQTAFKTVQFSQCKMLGLQFNNCNPFLLQLQFANCQLDFSNFYQMELKGTQFGHCSLLEADFTDTDLSSANLSHTQLAGTVFYQTNLEKADLRHAIGYTIVPEQNRLKGAKFSLPDVVGLLTQHGIVIE